MGKVPGLKSWHFGERMNEIILDGEYFRFLISKEYKETHQEFLKLIFKLDRFTIPLFMLKEMVYKNKDILSFLKEFEIDFTIINDEGNISVSLMFPSDESLVLFKLTY